MFGHSFLFSCNLVSWTAAIQQDTFLIQEKGKRTLFLILWVARKVRLELGTLTRLKLYHNKKYFLIESTYGTTLIVINANNPPHKLKTFLYLKLFGEMLWRISLRQNDDRIVAMMNGGVRVGGRLGWCGGCTWMSGCLCGGEGLGWGRGVGGSMNRNVMANFVWRRHQNCFLSWVKFNAMTPPPPSPFILQVSKSGQLSLNSILSAA
jgi:hypothetical protein